MTFFLLFPIKNSIYGTCYLQSVFVCFCIFWNTNFCCWLLFYFIFWSCFDNIRLCMVAWYSAPKAKRGLPQATEIVQLAIIGDQWIYSCIIIEGAEREKTCDKKKKVSHHTSKYLQRENNHSFLLFCSNNNPLLVQFHSNLYY